MPTLLGRWRREGRRYTKLNRAEDGWAESAQPRVAVLQVTLGLTGRVVVTQKQPRRDDEE
ncbi:MAG: hypothetical protein ACRD5W_13695 [Candidatus Acidiferrales bacterium]